MSISSRVAFCSVITTVLIYFFVNSRRKQKSARKIAPQHIPVENQCESDVESHTIVINSVNPVSLQPVKETQLNILFVPLHTVNTTLENPTVFEQKFESAKLSLTSEYCHQIATNIEVIKMSPTVIVPLNSNSDVYSNDKLSCSKIDAIPVPPGVFNDPMNDIYESNPEEHDGKILPTVLIPSDMWAQAVDKNIWRETFWIPAHMGGVLIGRFGKNVRELRNIWQANFSLNTCPGKQDTLLLNLSCPLKYKEDVLQWISQRFRMRPSKTTIGNPNQLKRNLPLGELVAVQVRSMYGSKELFVTIPDEEYTNYLTMQAELDEDYASLNNFRMQLCEPVTSGTIAIVPHVNGFARALIISVHQTWPKTVFYFLLDHGIFGVESLNKVKKIRAKYMQVPFQAIHVSWAHAFPVYSDIPDIHLLRTFFKSDKIHAFSVRMETCCRPSVALAESYSPIYKSDSFSDILVTACNSGLFMTAPLFIYSKRQCWLNGTNVPYYPFTYSAIDYQSLTSITVEDDFPVESCTTNSTNQTNDDRNKTSSSSRNKQPITQRNFNNGNGRGRGRGIQQPASQSSVYSRQSKPLISTQKENLYVNGTVLSEPSSNKVVVNGSSSHNNNNHTNNHNNNNCNGNIVRKCNGNLDVSKRKPLAPHNSRGSTGSSNLNGAKISTFNSSTRSSAQTQSQT